jgi:hypothetical protein
MGPLGARYRNATLATRSVGIGASLGLVKATPTHGPAPVRLYSPLLDASVPDHEYDCQPVTKLPPVTIAEDDSLAIVVVG